MKLYDHHVHVLSTDVIPKEFMYHRFELKKSTVEHALDIIHATIVDDLIEFTGDLLNEPWRVESFLDYFLSDNKSFMSRLEAELKPHVTGASILNIDFYDREFSEYRKYWDQQFEYSIFNPYIGIDPRRRNAVELVEQALKDGYKGIKLYPGVGWDPLSYLPTLHDIAKLAVKYDVPMVQHCSAGGYQTGPRSKYYNHPGNTYWIFNDFPELKYIYAHSGGYGAFVDYFTKNTPLDTHSYYWWLREISSDDIKRNSPYMDIAYHEGIILEPKKYKKAIEGALVDPFVKNRLIYGSDYPLIALFGDYGDYINSLKTILSDEDLNKLNTNSPI